MPSKPSNRLSVGELVLFAMLGAMMFASKVAMEALPNIHPLGAFIVAETVVFRRKALFPIYTYVFLNGVYAGFALWWIPYLYIWTLLWGMVMLLPRDLPQKAKPFVYAGVSALHGLLFGVLYSPAQAILFGFPLNTIPVWILSGLPYDCLHAAGNLAFGCLILPLIRLLETGRDRVRR